MKSLGSTLVLPRRRLLPNLLSLVALVLLVQASCGPLDDFAGSKRKESSSRTVSVSGIFADWGDAVRSVAGGKFVLVNAASSRAFWGDIRDNGAFAVADVQVNESYYAMVIGPDFRLSARLLSAPNASGLRRAVFSVGESDVLLGSLTMRDGIATSSRQRTISFVGTTGLVPAVPVPFVAARPSGDRKPDPDIDQDGYPNMVDPDWDGDGVPNVVDAALYSDGSDSSLSWNQHYGLAIGDFGFLACSWLLRSSLHSHRCVLSASDVGIRNARIETDGAAADFSAGVGTVRDDVWTAEFTRETPKGREHESLLGRLGLVSVVEEGGLAHGYVVQMGGAAPYTLGKASAQMEGDLLTATVDVAGWDEREGVYLQAIVTGDQGEWVRSTSAPLEVPVTTLSGLLGWPLVAGQKYDVVLRVVLPSHLAGLVGSAIETPPLTGVTWSNH